MTQWPIYENGVGEDGAHRALSIANSHDCSEGYLLATLDNLGDTTDLQ